MNAALGIAMTQDFLQLATEGALRLHHIDSSCVAAGCSRHELLNSLAMQVAHRYSSKEWDFSTADAAINTIWSVSVADASEQGDGFTLPELVFRIYEAFDAGEYDHGDGADPVAKYVDPQIKRILENA